jgi:hypothetical protein
MKTFMANTRYVGLTAAAILAIATLLTWISVSGPFIGGLTVTGIKTDDGKIALGLAVALGVVAFFAKRRWLGLCGIAFVGLYGYEYVHMTSYDLTSRGDSAFERSIEKAISINPGFGIYLGLLAGLALVVWGLVQPYMQQRQASLPKPAGEPPAA